MATRSFICAEDDSGMICGVYCHFDGYPEHHAPILKEYYNIFETVHELIDLGSLSCLDKTIESCTAYHRDRGEELDVLEFDSQDGLKEVWDMLGVEFVYLFTIKDGWKMSSYSNKNFFTKI